MIVDNGLIDKSPLTDYFQKVDEGKPDATYSEYEKVAYDLYKQDRYYGTRLFLDDAQFRANNQKNLISSVSGQQGTGKSLFSVCLNWNIGVIFGNYFDIGRDTFVNPYDLHDTLYSEGNRRRTFLYDEQPVYRAGIGSSAVGFALKNYEDICRKTQNNLTYCSPEIVDHSHYFVFEQCFHDHERVNNPKCHVCAKYKECVLNDYSTLCGIPFNLRNGYPKEFSFMLVTKKLTGKYKLEIPRLIVTFPMIAPELAKKYNEVKNKNIVNFESYKDKTSEKMKERLKEFIKEHRSELIKTKIVKGLRVYITQSKLVFKSYFIEYFGRSRFVDQETEMWVLRAKSIVDAEVSKKNELEFIKYQDAQEELRKALEEKRVAELEVERLKLIERRESKELLTRKA